MGLTVIAFANAYRAIRRGDSHQANRMFRARVAAQGFTVIAMVVGSLYYSQDRAKSKELRRLKELRDAEEKRQKWIRELEARDEEEKALKARLMGTQQPDRSSVGPEVDGAPVQADSGGFLSRLGLWPRQEDDAGSRDTAEAKNVKDKKPRRENPNSSLSAISEVISAKKTETGQAVPPAKASERQSEK